MTVRNTSREAYGDLQATGALGRQQFQILTLLDGLTKSLRRDFTRQEISSLSGLPINVITPRVNELIKAGFLAEIGRRRCGITGRVVIALVVEARRQKREVEAA